MATFNLPKVPRPTHLEKTTDVWRSFLPYSIICLGIWIELGSYIWIGAFVVAVGIYFFNETLPDRKTMNFVPQLESKSRWVTVTPTEIGKLKSKLKTIEKTAGSGGCIYGLGLIVGVVGCFFFEITYVEIFGSGAMEALKVLSCFFPNMVLIFGTLLFLGTPQTWSPNKIIFKLPILERLFDYSKTLGAADWKKEYQLELAKTERGEVPVDVKISLKPPDCPAEFYGVQGQVSQNRGQPYVYFVVIAKTGFEVFLPPEKVDLPGQNEGFLGSLVKSLVSEKNKEVYEEMKDNEVNALVIRQFADKHGGYITIESDQKRLLRKSILSGGWTADAMRKELV